MSEEYFSTVLRIVEGGMRGDITKVKNYALLLADKYESDLEIEKAFYLRKLAHGETGAKVIPMQQIEIGTLTADGHLIGEE